MSGKPLRPYQTALVRGVSAAYRDGLQAVLMQSATGSGKTRTAVYIVEKYTSTGRVVLWLVHREELLMQAALTFAENGIEHHLVCAASSERAIKAQQFREFGRSFVKNGAKVVIASIQTIVRRLDSLDWLQPSQIVADECHLSLAATWRRVLAHWPEARLLGLTATPWRLDGQSFARAEGGLYDVMVPGPKLHELVGWGNLAPIRIYAPPVHLVEGIKIRTKGDDYNPDDLEKELDSAVVYGDVVEHYRNLSHGKPAIGFCPTVQSSEKFAAAFRQAGYRAVALDGGTDDTIRRQSLLQLSRGELDVVMSVSILVEGTDIPYATTALWLRKTKSLSMFLQGVGRVRRAHPDKEYALLLDFVGVTDDPEIGLPDEDREWSLQGRVKREKKAANDNGADVAVITCPNCKSKIEPQRFCPGIKFVAGVGEPCGYEFKPKERREMEQVDGELQEVNQAEAEERLRRLRRAMQGQQQTVEDLMRSMNMSRTRAEKIVQARQEKATAIIDILDQIDAIEAATGHGPFALFKATRAAIRKMKPKELKALAAQVQEKAAALREAA